MKMKLNREQAILQRGIYAVTELDRLSKDDCYFYKRLGGGYQEWRGEIVDLDTSETIYVVYIVHINEINDLGEINWHHHIAYYLV